ncbi:hypothetical protein AX16_003801 [Volvariella volvacea WC 439]|nr:hypothetical protein AX16_003801 [Volvariella volvacea WC 439]
MHYSNVLEIALLVVKLLFTVLNPIAFYQSTTPPKDGQRSGDEKDIVPHSSLRESVTMLMTRYNFIIQGIYAVFSGLEALRIGLALLHGYGVGVGVYPNIATTLKPESTLRFPDTAYLIGSTLVTFGWILRRQCYSALKKHFTFHITTLKDHQLITSGPYSIVRHPSYVGILMVMIGAAVTVYSPGSWLHDSGATGSPGVALVIYFWSIHSLGISMSLPFRMPLEDELLRKRFGKEWEAYAKKVPYQLIPGIL